jgi:hypothetical protein
LSIAEGVSGTEIERESEAGREGGKEREIDQS